MERKKILYVHHSHTRGGAPRSLLFLIEQLPRQDFCMDFMCIYDEDGNRKWFEKYAENFYFSRYSAPFHGSTVCHTNSIKQLFVQIVRIPLTVLDSAKYIKKSNADIMHLNSTCLWPVALAGRIVRPKMKIVCHIREPLINHIDGKIINYFCGRLVDAFIAIDRFDASTVNSHGKPMHIIYNAVDFTLYNSNIKSNELRCELGLDKNDIIFLYLARVSVSNGAYEMITHVGDVIKKNPRIHFVIMGAFLEKPDEYTNKVIEAANAYKSNVHILPFRTNVPSIIASSDVMVVPFTQPHFARSIIEAAAMGVPSLGSDIGGPQELIINNKTGLLFDHDSYTDFADKCLAMAQKEIRTQMSKAAIEFAEEFFDSVKNSNKTFDVYKDLTKNKKQHKGTNHNCSKLKT